MGISSYAINYSVKNNRMTLYLARWGSSAGFEAWLLVKENIQYVNTFNTSIDQYCALCRSGPCFKKLDFQVNQIICSEWSEFRES